MWITTQWLGAGSRAHTTCLCCGSRSTISEWFVVDSVSPPTPPPHPPHHPANSEQFDRVLKRFALKKPDTARIAAITLRDFPIMLHVPVYYIRVYDKRRLRFTRNPIIVRSRDLTVSFFFLFSRYLWFRSRSNQACKTIHAITRELYAWSEDRSNIDRLDIAYKTRFGTSPEWAF